MNSEAKPSCNYIDVTIFTRQQIKTITCNIKLLLAKSELIWEYSHDRHYNMHHQC